MNKRAKEIEQIIEIKERNENTKLILSNPSLNETTGTVESTKSVGPIERAEKLFALLSYCSSSILMTVTNRWIFSRSKADMNFFLLSLQTISALTLMLVLRLMNIVSFEWISGKKARAWFHVVCLLVGMLFTSSKGLHYLHVANFTVCKNIMIVFLTIADIVIFHGSLNELMIQGLILIILGSILGGYSDLQFSMNGYSWLLVNCLCSGLYLVEMRRMIKKVHFRDFDTVFYNTVLSLPILLLLSVVFDEWKLFVKIYLKEDPIVSGRNSFLLGIGLSCIAGFAISYSSAWCLRVLSTTTYSVAGALNKLPVSISGLLFFQNERNFNLGNILSILFAFVGGCFYSVGQILNRQQEMSEATRTNETQPILIGGQAERLFKRETDNVEKKLTIAGRA